MIKTFSSHKFRYTLIVSIGIHLLGIGWLGFSLNDRSPVSVHEPVMTVDLVSIPSAEAVDIQKNDSPPLNVQPQISPQRTDTVSVDAPSNTPVDKGSLRDPIRAIRETAASTLSVPSVQEQSDSVELTEKSGHEEFEEKIIPVERVQANNPAPSLPVASGNVKADPSFEHFQRDGEVFKGEAVNLISEPGSLPGKPSQSEKDAWSNYLKAVKDRIEHLKRYPRLARLRGREGSTRLGFTIALNGEPGNVRLLQSSGWKELDEESVDILKRVGRFPHPPDNWNEDLRVEVPMVFHLGDVGNTSVMR